MTFKATAVLLATLLAAPVIMTQASFADSKGKSSTTTSSATTTETKLKARLTPALGLIGEGEAEYKNKVSSKGTEEKFSGEVEFPVTDLIAAQANVFEMHLARLGAEYAVCSLVIKEIEFKYQAGNPVPVAIEAEYEVSASQKTPVGGVPTVSQKVGNCAPALPAVQALDTVTVVQEGFSLPLLTGTFQLDLSH